MKIEKVHEICEDFDGDDPYYVYEYYRSILFGLIKIVYYVEHRDVDRFKHTISFYVFGRKYTIILRNSKCFVYEHGFSNEVMEFDRFQYGKRNIYLWISSWWIKDGWVDWWKYMKKKFTNK